MITPTVGRVVWYHPERAHTQPWAALITYVHSDRLVNLVAFDSEGFGKPKASVQLVQDANEERAANYCEWMPYQTGQAAKTEALQKQLGATAT